MYKRIFQFIVGITLLSTLLTACGGDRATPTTEPSPTRPSREEIVIDVWFHSGAGGEMNALKQSVAAFHAMRDDARIEVVELPETTYVEQVEAAAFGAGIAGDLPCLLDFDGPNTYNYVWSDFLIPLDDYISPEMKEDFLPSIITQGTFQDGKLYSLAQFESGLAIWGNKAYLEEAGVRLPTVDDPWTREEFEQVLAELQALPQVEYALDMKMNYGIGEWFTYGFSPILQSFGADLIDRSDYQSADGVLNGPEAVAAMEMVQGWFEKGYVNADTQSDTDFTDGKTALSWVGHWVANTYIDALGDDLLLLPIPDFGTGPKTGMGSWNWGITATCKHPDAAWQVLEFILNPDQILLMSDVSGSIPARRSALDRSELYSPDGPLYLYIEQIEADFAVPRPITPAYPTISRAFAEAFNNIVRGADVQSELDKTVQAIDQDIQEHGGYPLK